MGNISTSRKNEKRSERSLVSSIEDIDWKDVFFDIESDFLHYMDLVNEDDLPRWFF